MFVTSGLNDEFERIKRELGEDDPYDNANTIGIFDVLKAHFLIADYFYSEEEGRGIASVGPRDCNLFHSTLSRQLVCFGDTFKWTNSLDICATLFFGLIKNHPFYDANKRTAFLVVVYHLLKVGRYINCPQKELENLALAIAENTLSTKPAYKKTFHKFSKMDDPEVRYISYYLHKITRKIDKSYHVITFKQLNQILNNYGYELANPSGNYIDVIRREERTSLFGKKTTEQKKIMKIGFPGWREQVNVKAINSVRRSTGLTAENGIDSMVFYNNVETMESLISSYKGPLRRLAKK